LPLGVEYTLLQLSGKNPGSHLRGKGRRGPIGSVRRKGKEGGGVLGYQKESQRPWSNPEEKQYKRSRASAPHDRVTGCRLRVLERKGGVLPSRKRNLDLLRCFRKRKLNFSDRERGNCSVGGTALQRVGGINKKYA